MNIEEFRLAWERASDIHKDYVARIISLNDGSTLFATSFDIHTPEFVYLFDKDNFADVFMPSIKGID